MKSKLNKVKVSVITTALTVLCNFNTVFAGTTPTPKAKSGGANDIISNVNTATDTVFSIIAAVGGLFFGIGIITAVRGNSKGMDDKVDKGIAMAIAGMVMVGIKVIVGMFN